MGRIGCRVVACVPPWEVAPSCTTANAQDNGTAEQNEPCWTSAFPTPRPPQCNSPATNCQTISMAPTSDGTGYRILTSFRKLFAYGDFPNDGDESSAVLARPMVGIAAHLVGGYYFVAADGGIFAFGDAPFFGSMGAQPLNLPIVGMAATPSGNGCWWVPPGGGFSPWGDALFFGPGGGRP